MNAFKTKQSEKKTAARNARCQFCSNVKTLKKARIKELYEAMLDSSIATPTIVAVLDDWDIVVGSTTIHNHRHGKEGFAVHMLELRDLAGIK